MKKLSFSSKSKVPHKRRDPDYIIHLLRRSNKQSNGYHLNTHRDF